MFYAEFIVLVREFRLGPINNFYKSQSHMHGMVAILVPPCYSRWSETSLNSWIVSTWWKPISHWWKENWETTHLPRLPRSPHLTGLGQRGAMVTGAWHACEWSNDFSLLVLIVLTASSVQIEGKLSSSVHTLSSYTRALCCICLPHPAAYVASGLGE